MHRLYRLYSVPHRRRVLQKRGYLVLCKLKETLEKYDIPGFLAFGSLLGFVRDGRFMPHDDDIDIGVLPGGPSSVELLRLLVEQEGYKFEYAFKFRGRLVEFKVSYMGVPVDFFCYERQGEDFFCNCFYYFPECHYPSANANSVWRIHQYNTKSLTTMRVFDIDFPIPVDHEKVLERLYGETWRAPNPNWSDVMHPGREELIDEYAFSIPYEEAVGLHG